MADRTVTVRLRALTSDWTSGLSRAATETTKFARTNERALSTAGKAAMGLGAAMVGSSALTAKAAMDFESSFAGVRKTVDATEAQFAALSAGFRRMATEIRVTVNELNGIGEAAGQLGIETDNIEGFTRTMADLGVATNMAADEAATSLARLANITQMPQSEFDRLGSTVVDLGNNLATTESEIVEMGLRLAGAGAQIGMTEADILALGGALSSLGIRAEAGGSALSRVMIEIASQVETGGELLGEFAQVAGMSAEQFAEAWREDATGALVEFITGLGRVDEQGGSTLQTLESLEITEIRMRDALLRAAGAGDLLADAVGRGNTAWDENNALTAEAAQRYQTAESRLQIAKNQLNDLAIDIGAGVLPMVVELAETGAGLAGMLAGLPAPIRQIGGAATFAGGGVIFLGGATAFLLPKVAAAQAGLAAMGISTASLGATARTTAAVLTGPWALAIGGATAGMMAWSKAAQSVEQSIADVKAVAADGDIESALRGIREEFSEMSRSEGFMADLGRALRQMIGGTTLGHERAEVFAAAISDLGETSASAALELIELAEAEGIVRREADGSISALSHMGDATAMTAMEVVNLGAAAEKQRRDANAAAAQNDVMAASMGGLAGATGAAAAGVEDLTGEVQDAESAFDSLAPSIEAAFTTLGAGLDPMARYQESLQHINDAHRKAAEETAKATESSKDSWEDYFTETDASFEAYRESLQNTLTNQRQWHANLNKIRDAAGDEYADMLAAQGPEYADLHAAIAAEEAESIQAGANEHLAIRDEAIQEGVDRLIRSSPEWVDAAGQVSGETVAEIADKLNTTEEVVRDAIDNSKPALEAAMGRLAEAAGLGSAKVVGAMIGELSLGASDIAAVTASWSSAMAKGLNPIVVAVKGEPIVVDAPAVIGPSRGTLHPMANRNTGGLIPGRGPNADTVPAMLTQGEYVVARDAVDRYGVQALEALNSGRLDPHALHLNTGGFVTPDDLPGVPRFDSSAPAMNAAGTRAVEGVLAMAKEWMDENAFAGSIAGAGAGRGNINAELLRRFDAWSAWLQANRGVGPLGVTSGYRSNAQQAVLYRRYKAGLGPVAAPPGSSKHNRDPAEAIDHGPYSWGWAGSARQFGLHHPVRSEAWHVEAMAEGGIATRPTLAMIGEAGPEAVIPLNAGGLVGTLPAAPNFPGSSLRLDPDEYRRRVEVNNRLFELGMLTLDQHLSNLERRMLHTVPFSDEWMSLFEQRKRLVDDLLDDHLRAVDDAVRGEESAFADLNRLLDERDRLGEAMVEAQERRDEQALAARGRFDDAFAAAEARRTQVLAEATTQRNERLLALEERFAAERERIVSGRADALFVAFDPQRRVERQWANSMGAVTRNLAAQLADRQAWSEGLDQLRAMGLSDDAAAALGLDQLTAESLATVQLWSDATADEVDALNAGIAASHAWAADRAETEAARQQGAVGEALVELTRSVADETAQVHADHRARLAEIHGEFTDTTAAAREELNTRIAELDAELHTNLTRMQADMAAIGGDQGRSYADAISEGIRSGIPAIVAATEAAQAAMRSRQEAEAALETARDVAAANPVAGRSASVAPLGHHYVLPDGRHMLRLSNQAWYHASGPGQRRELERLYGTPTPHPSIREDRIVGSLVSLFGAGGMEQFTRAHVQPRYFDSGGWLAPNSATLAINNTARWEPVGMGTHGPALDTGGKAQTAELKQVNRNLAKVAEAIDRGQVIVMDRREVGRVMRRELA